MVACGRVEPVSARAGVGEEAEQGPFAELGGQGAGVDVEHSGEFWRRPVARGVAGDDGGDLLAAGGWPGWPGVFGRVVDAAGAWVQRRGDDGDLVRPVDLRFLVGAGEGNRTLMTSLEDRWCDFWHSQRRR